MKLRVVLFILIFGILIGLGFWIYTLQEKLLSDSAKPSATTVAAVVEEKGDAKAVEPATTVAAEVAEPNEPDKAVEPNEVDKVEDVNEAGEPNEPNEPNDLADPLEALNLKDVEMKDIVQKLAEWTGKVVIPSDDAMKQKITIYSPEEVPRSQALSLIYAALRMKGVVAEQGDDRIFLKPISEAKLGAVPTIGVNEPLARIEDKSQIVEKYFLLKNYSPARLVEIISPLTAEYGHVTAVENTGSVAVIDTVENLLRIKRIIEQLDVPESEQTVEEIFEVEHGDPGEIVQMLNLIIGKDKSRRADAQKAQPGKDQKVKPATSVVIEPSESLVKLIPVPKHNWIIARASGDDMKKIAEWIEKLDVKDISEPEQSIVQVRYVDVREVVNIVKKTIQDVPGTELKASIVVEALPQSRQIVIFGSEENRKMVENLIAEIDLPTTDIFEQKTFVLKHADSDQIKKNIEEL